MSWHEENVIKRNGVAKTMTLTFHFMVIIYESKNVKIL